MIRMINSDARVVSNSDMICMIGSEAKFVRKWLVRLHIAPPRLDFMAELSIKRYSLHCQSSSERTQQGFL